MRAICRIGKLGQSPSAANTKTLVSRLVDSLVSTSAALAVREAVNNLVKESVQSALRLVDYLEAMYGKPQVYARAWVVNTLLQLKSEPDFIVGLPGR